jgi:hypothetical protein
MYKKFSCVIIFGLLVSLAANGVTLFPGWACAIIASSTKQIVKYRLSKAAIIVCWN